MDAEPSTRRSLLIRLRDLDDEDARSEFTTLYGPLVLRSARRRGLQDADAQDLVQNVFRDVAGAIERYDPGRARGSFRRWLARIARNLTVNRFAAQRRQPRGSGVSDVQRLLEQSPDPSHEDSVLFDTEYRQRLIAWPPRGFAEASLK